MSHRGGLAIAEETIGGRQCTVEGYVYQGEPRAYAVIDSIRGPNRTSFHRYAAKFMPRRYQDAVVTRAPSAEDIARVQKAFPDAAVSLEVSSGMRLSDLPNQDSYSYELGEIFLGGPSHRRLVQDYERIMEMLNFRFDTAISKSAMAG